jgi:hypothetical protein
MLTVHCASLLDRALPTWRRGEATADSVLLRFISEHVSAIIVSTRLCALAIGDDMHRHMEKCAARSRQVGESMEEAKRIVRHVFGACADSDISDARGDFWNRLGRMCSSAADKTDFVARIAECAARTSIAATMCIQALTQCGAMRLVSHEQMSHVMLTSLFKRAEQSTGHVIAQALSDILGRVSEPTVQRAIEHMMAHNKRGSIEIETAKKRQRKETRPEEDEEDDDDPFGLSRSMQRRSAYDDDEDEDSDDEDDMEDTFRSKSAEDVLENGEYAGGETTDTSEQRSTRSRTYDDWLGDTSRAEATKRIRIDQTDQPSSALSVSRIFGVRKRSLL